MGKPAPLELLIDVGANIGTICIPAVKRGYFQRAIAVEPAPRNFALLSKNISANGLDGRIVPHNVALAAVSGATLTFELSDNNFGDHRVRMNGSVGSYGEAARKTISVKTETLDNLAPGIDPKSTLIWMDTQGFEGHVLSGARAALAQRTPICMEFWAYGLDYSGGFSLLKECLIGNRYDRVYDVDEPTQPPQPASAETLDRLYEKYRDPRKAADLVVM